MTAFCSLMMAVALAGDASSDRPRTLVETGNLRHIAVVGDGYLMAEDEDQKQYFLRSCVLVEDAAARLCAKAGDKLIVLHPPIVLPSDTLKFFIATDGTVDVHHRTGGNLLSAIGTFQVAFPDDRTGMREIAPGVWTFDHAVPTVMAFGPESRCFLMQGWLEGDLRKPAKKKTGRREK